MIYIAFFDFPMVVSGTNVRRVMLLFTSIYHTHFIQADVACFKLLESRCTNEQATAFLSQCEICDKYVRIVELLIRICQLLKTRHISWCEIGLINKYKK